MSAHGRSRRWPTTSSRCLGSTRSSGLEKPGHFANYGLTVGDDATLTEWMWVHLALAVWPTKVEAALRKVERGVVLLLDPPLNIEYLPRSTRRDLRWARKAMADDARRWAADHVPVRG